MRKLLVTAFEPFGGQSLNSSWEVAKALPDTVLDWEIYRMRIPVTFDKGTMQAVNDLRGVDPLAVLCLGQAAGRAAVTPELFAHNLRYAAQPDALGALPQDTPVIAGGPLALMSTLPARRMAEAIAAEGIPARLSYDAGTYVCNELFYRMLSNFDRPPFKVGFIHLPLLPEQTAEGTPDEGKPSLTLEQMTAAVVRAIEEFD